VTGWRAQTQEVQSERPPASRSTGMFADFMKLAKATPEEVDALLNLMRVLNTAEDNGIPCKPDGTWEEVNDAGWFDCDKKEHLRKFYDRVMGCFAEHPGGLSRTVGGYYLAMTNGVFDPAAQSYEWHPDLLAAVAARESNIPANAQDERPLAAEENL